jgi:hypothetical protein
MTSSSDTTTDHDEIRKWVEERKGKPARVKGTGNKTDKGVLRIDFPDGEEENLEQISWEDFFDKFDKEKLAFLYQDKSANGKKSYFNKLVNQDNGK